MEAAPLQKPPRAQRCLWKAGFPRSGTLILPTLSLSCLALLTPILSVRSVVLLGLCQEEIWATGAAGSPGSSKTFQGSASPPISADVGNGCAAWAPLLGWRWNCAHTSSVYFLQDLEYSCWFTTAGHVFSCVVHAPDLWNKTKERGHLSFIDLTMNGSMRVAP